MEAINATARDLIENGGGFIGGGMELNSRSARSITFEVLSFSKSVGRICNNADQVLSSEFLDSEKNKIHACYFLLA